MGNAVQLAGSTGGITSKSDLALHMNAVRKSVPQWCRKHPDFESVADEVIAKALLSHDPARGGYRQHLAVRSQSRIARTLMRESKTMLRRSGATVLDLTDVLDAELVSSPDVIADPTVVVDAQLTVEAFAATLLADEAELVILLTIGKTQADIAKIIGVSARQVSRLVDRLKPKAATFFGRFDLLEATVAA